MSVPVRKIPKNHRSVTGIVPEVGAYESTLERDFMEILRFDKNVREVNPQPIVVHYTNKKGRPAIYTPDGLIHFVPTLSEPPVLFEVKYREDFRKDWRNLIEKFRAAKAYCQERYWRFQVFTELEIRTPYLQNVKFLWPFRQRTVEQGWRNQILDAMADLQEADPEILLFALCKDPMNRALVIPMVWNLLANGEIGCDLDVKLTMRSKIWNVMDI